MVSIDKNAYIEAASNRIKESIFCLDDKNGLLEEEGKPVFREVDGMLFIASGSVDSIKSAMEIKLRNDDIVVASWPKAGSTWLRHIVLQLIDDNYFNGVTDQYLESPMIEFMGGDIVDLLPSPRILKTHFPLKCCPMSDTAKYILVVRNPKDVLISFYHHMKLIPSYNFKNGDINVLFNIFVSGKIEYGSYFDYLLEWDSKIKNDNIFLVKYEDMYSNQKVHIEKLAHFIGGKAVDRINDSNSFEKIIEESTISNMKKDIERFTGRGSNNNWFIRKGGSGGWREYLTEEQSKIIDNIFYEKLKGTIFENMWSEEMKL